MIFEFEAGADLLFGFENSAPPPENNKKGNAGITELKLSGTALFAAGKTIFEEEQNDN